MVTINEHTKFKPTKPTSPASAKGSAKATAGGKKKAGTASGKSGSGASGGGGGKASGAPPLKPKEYGTAEARASLQTDEDLRAAVSKCLRAALGDASLFSNKGAMSKPHAASTTRDRATAAADLGTLAKEFGVVRVMKRLGVLSDVERILLPDGPKALFDGALSAGLPALPKSDLANKIHGASGGGMKAVSSASSLTHLAGMLEDAASAAASSASGGTDSKRGKSAPADAREGCLLILRGLCEIVGRTAEPFVVPLFCAALDETASTVMAVREAAEDTTKAIVKLANPLAVPLLLCPVIFAAISHTSEWRVKQNALDRLSQCATTAPLAIARLLPRILPPVTSEVFDTKPQVTKAASACLLAVCQTNLNPDVKPAIPAVVEAIVKPSDSMKAVDQLQATTFVATVDASTLAILCPVLSRGLKEKMALSKRSCCVVIENMSRLVETPDAVAPFGPLLVPELQKVAENVQFEEIRDAALAALKALTKALGHASIEAGVAAVMAAEAERIEAEQQRIAAARAEDAQQEEEDRKREEEERLKWKEAQEAQRELDKIAAKKEEERKVQAQKKREAQKKSTKAEGGKCQGCGLKKCKKSCPFHTG